LVAFLTISKFPDAQLRICGSMLSHRPGMAAAVARRNIPDQSFGASFLFTLPGLGKEKA
jgi:hypothetical protein